MNEKALIKSGLNALLVGVEPTTHGFEATKHMCCIYMSYIIAMNVHKIAINCFTNRFK